MQVTHGGFHCEVGTKRSGNAVKQNRLLEDESLQEDGIFFKRRQTIMSEKPKYYITTAIAWQMRSHVIREVRDMTYFSRREQMSMGRRSS